MAPSCSVKKRGDGTWRHGSRSARCGLFSWGNIPTFLSHSLSVRNNGPHDEVISESDSQWPAPCPARSKFPSTNTRIVQPSSCREQKRDPPCPQSPSTTRLLTPLPLSTSDVTPINHYLGAWLSLLSPFEGRDFCPLVGVFGTCSHLYYQSWKIKTSGKVYILGKLPLISNYWGRHHPPPPPSWVDPSLQLTVPNLVIPRCLLHVHGPRNSKQCRLYF